MATNSDEIIRVKHAKLHPGETNRIMRSGMDEKSLGELADSIITHGIVQPLIIRPHQKTGEYEIVAGERRWRAFEIAMKKAKLKDEVPCILTEYTDGHVNEIRLIENVQREGIHALEEAAGYRELLEMKDDKGHDLYTINSLADKIGKSVAFVYGRIKLLDMPEIAQKAIAAGKLSASVALLISRIPDPKLAAKATCEVLAPYGTNRDEAVALDPEVDAISYRAAKKHIQDNYMIRLKGAPFDQDDATLVPIYGNDAIHLKRAGGGACTDCPFRTGNMKAQGLETDSTDVCTNTACFKKKKDAAFNREKNKFSAKGQTLLSATQSRNVLDWEGTALSSNGRTKYVDLREQAPGKKKTWEEVLEKHLPEDAPITVARGKKTLLLLPVEVATTAAQKAGIKFEPPKENASYGSAEHEQQQAEWKVKREKTEAIAQAAHKLLLQRVGLPRHQKHVHEHGYAATLFNPGSDKEWKDALAKVRKMDVRELSAALFINQFMDSGRYVNHHGEYQEVFIALCGQFEIDIKELEKAAVTPQKEKK